MQNLRKKNLSILLVLLALLEMPVVGFASDPNARPESNPISNYNPDANPDSNPNLTAIPTSTARPRIDYNCPSPTRCTSVTVSIPKLDEKGRVIPGEVYKRVTIPAVQLIDRAAFSFDCNGQAFFGIDNVNSRAICASLSGANQVPTSVVSSNLNCPTGVNGVTPVPTGGVCSPPTAGSTPPPQVPEIPVITDTSPRPRGSISQLTPPPSFLPPPPVTPEPTPPPDLQCHNTPWGTVPDGFTGKAYEYALRQSGNHATDCETESEMRTCRRGTMDGSFAHLTCVQQPFDCQGLCGGN